LQRNQTCLRQECYHIYDTIMNGGFLMHAPGLSGWILIIIVALFLFGPKKLPEIGRTLGQTLREFKNSAEGLLKEKEEKDTKKKEIEHKDS
jgi:sec-independent protein translocase protein TatA